MRRGQSRENRNVEGFTKRELMEAAGVTSGMFDVVRRAARVRGPSHGGMDWVYSREDVMTMARKAQDGNLRERAGDAGKAWEALLAGGREEE